MQEEKDTTGYEIHMSAKQFYPSGTSNSITTLGAADLIA